MAKALTFKQKEDLPDECVSDHHHSEESHEEDDASIDHCAEVENPDEIQIENQSSGEQDSKLVS